MTRTILLLVLASAACGDNLEPAIDAGPRADADRDASNGGIDAAIDAPMTTRRCGAMGSGTVTGTVNGVTITPVVRAVQVTIPGQGVAIVLDEAGTGCTTSTTGEHLALLMCAAPTVRTIPVVNEQAFNCPGTNAFGLIEQGTTDIGESTGGTIVVTDISDGCSTGTFTINYMNEQLTGSFDAYVCP